jgi:prepilin-type N-terminal cleavage/methylation domain-containing protein
MKTIQKGFTLIELVIVMVIIGILAAGAAAKYVDLVPASKTASAQAGLMALSTTFAELIGQNAATTPAAPYPTVANITAVLGSGVSLTANKNICTAAGSGLAVPGYLSAASCSGASTLVSTASVVQCISNANIVDAGC